ncbi:50S ribosomal protein L11 methyltransferase [Adhaeribacter rhizoryzae]|uniref:Ribosomal protein L11 methyltransferase n=1 Tax=Adhaeribacter rhizoryzae TaxID=2607907 RepID=A0A5M6DDU5_9BACT|nr:50S ribosomal protein L11 methyltransferase [Adhaeribacter rhizoryzae]KAA5543365.1 50S ribosomal protein L11 methyltransferase [Adhaeribacter rhizoryzae]
MDFIQITIFAPTAFNDILTAELSQYGYDTFMETDEGLCAYITEDIFSETDLQEVLNKYREAAGEIKYTIEKIEKKNWNEEWEKNFEPLLIADICSVRASFHPKPEGVAYDIVINPKMSFGTGHHETTTLMIENQLTVDHAGKRVLDMGCGTGILAILACKLGGTEILAVDIEDWTVENARENADFNDCAAIEVRLGDAAVIEQEQPFNIILANINRNVLLVDLPVYNRILAAGGTLIMSGFYTEDLDQIKEKAASVGLNFTSNRIKNNWVSVVFEKE